MTRVAGRKTKEPDEDVRPIPGVQGYLVTRSGVVYSTHTDPPSEVRPREPVKEVEPMSNDNRPKPSAERLRRLVECVKSGSEYTERGLLHGKRIAHVEAFGQIFGFDVYILVVETGRVHDPEFPQVNYSVYAYQREPAEMLRAHQRINLSLEKAIKLARELTEDTETVERMLDV